MLGVAGQRRTPAGAADRLGHPTSGAGREHRPAPDQGVGLRQGDGQHLGGVDRDVAVGRARQRHPVEGVGHQLVVGLRAEVGAVEVLEHQDGDGELVAGRAGQDRAPAACGVLGHQGVLGARHDDPAAAPDRLGDRGRRADVAALGRQHDDQVQRTRPARQPRVGPGHERHRAPRLEGGPQQSRVGPGGDDRTRTALFAGDRDGLGQGALRLDGLAADPRAGLREHPEARVGGGEDDLVVQAGLVEPGHGADQPGCRASSTSSTGMSSRTG